MEPTTTVLYPAEAEGIVQNLETFPLKDIGNSRWFRQHEYIEKLNMQAIMNASAGQDEFVKEHLIAYGKVFSTVVYSPVLYPLGHSIDLQTFIPGAHRSCSMDRSYDIQLQIHHEATVINLLETVLYYKDSCESAEESILDLIDYCLRKLTWVAAQVGQSEHSAQSRLTQTDHTDATTLQELQKQSMALEFDISLKALSILRYVTDHIDSLTLSALTRMLNTHNLPCILVQLVEHCPWSRKNKGKLEKYMDGRWYEVPAEDHLKMTKLDGQVWIALYNLLLRPECQQKYDFNNFNKSQLLKLRGFLTEVLIDQLPNLVELQRFLSHLAVTDPAPPKKDLILEQIPEIRDNILKENAGKWKAIAKHQVKQVFSPSEEDLREQACRLAQTYNLDVMETLIPEKPKCGHCGSEASKRCSRCQTEWYCGRECQVKHWQKHKQACGLISDAMSKTETGLKAKPL
ncbi:ZMY10 protein, partial [Polypterus senegalus]|nr:ZMY10 protein [Polypterus senegalus]